MIDSAKSSSEHWLVSTVKKAGLAGSADALCCPGTSNEKAWVEVARACHLTETELADHVAREFNAKVASVTECDPDALKHIPSALARSSLVFPLRKSGSTITVATADPTNFETEHLIEFASRHTVEFEIMPPTVLREVIHKSYSPEALVESLLESLDGEDHDVSFVEESQPEEISHEDVEARPVVKLTNMILRDGVSSCASDIHLDPKGELGVIRFRVDGVLRHHMEMPLSILNRVVSRLKILGRLDIAERFKPQDGRARIIIGQDCYDLRISTIPVSDTEKSTVRILDPQNFCAIDDLKMQDEELQGFKRLLQYRDGLVIVTGPTGSGKTTTLYAALQDMNSREVNIMSVEDPVEYDMPGINQIQVDGRRGMTFAATLRALLRQDPDVIFVGEIRDAETAAVAVQASMTGHLVLATMHTADSIGVVSRLRDLGVDCSSIAETLRGVLAQRLVRKNCEECTGAVEPSDSSMKNLAIRFGVLPVAAGKGCAACRDTGFRGRIPVTELFVAGIHERELIFRGAHFLDLKRAAVAAGAGTLQESAARLVEGGETTLAELRRVFGEEDWDASREPADAGEDQPVSRTRARRIRETVPGFVGRNVGNS